MESDKASAAAMTPSKCEVPFCALASMAGCSATCAVVSVPIFSGCWPAFRMSSLDMRNRPDAATVSNEQWQEERQRQQREDDEQSEVNEAHRQAGPDSVAGQVVLHLMIGRCSRQVRPSILADAAKSPDFDFRLQPWFLDSLISARRMVCVLPKQSFTRTLLRATKERNSGQRRRLESRALVVGLRARPFGKVTVFGRPSGRDASAPSQAGEGRATETAIFTAISFDDISGSNRILGGLNKA